MKILISSLLLVSVLFAQKGYFVQLSAAKNAAYLKETKRSLNLKDFKIIKKSNGFFAIVKETKSKKEAYETLKRYKKKFKEAFIYTVSLSDQITLNLSKRIDKRYEKTKDFKCYITLPKGFSIKKSSVRLNGEKISSLKVEKNYMEFYLKNPDLKRLHISFSIEESKNLKPSEIEISAFARNEENKIVTLIKKMDSKRLNLALKAYIYDFSKHKEKNKSLG